GLQDGAALTGARVGRENLFLFLFVLVLFWKACYGPWRTVSNRGISWLGLRFALQLVCSSQLAWSSPSLPCCSWLARRPPRIGAKISPANSTSTCSRSPGPHPFARRPSSGRRI